MKAANILITKQGILKLADFGLARAISINKAGQHQHLARLAWEDIKVKLEPRVSQEMWTSGVSSLSPSPTDISLYMNLATVAALPAKVSRHNTQSRAHNITKIIKTLTSSSNENVVIVCRQEDVYAS